MSFKFNFGTEKSEFDDPKEPKKPPEDGFNGKHQNFPCSSKKAREIKIAWQNVEGDTDKVKLQNKEELLTVCVKAVEEHLKIQVSEGETSEESSELVQAIERNSDLISHVYEGGLTIWECSYDLCDYLSSLSIAFRGLKVLELGCGAALPGLYAFKHGAEVHFQDYNEEVVQLVTIPNVKLNCDENDDSKDIERKCKFYAGDWNSLCDVLVEHTQNDDIKKYDLILTSETIYNVEYYRSLLDLMAAVLKPTGKIYLAAKTYYFGVGGGTREFQEMVKEEGVFKIEVCKEQREGVKREILEMSFSNKNS